MVIVSTITIEPYGIVRSRLNVLESRHYGLECGHKILIISTKNKRVIVVEFGPSSFTMPKSNLWS